MPCMLRSQGIGAGSTTTCQRWTMRQNLRASFLSTMTAFSLPRKALTGQSNPGRSQKYAAKLILRLACERFAVFKMLEVDSLELGNPLMRLA